MKQLLWLLVAMPLIAWANPDVDEPMEPTMDADLAYEMAPEEAEAEPELAPEPAPAPSKKPAAYTLPFHLRPVSAGNVVRLDNVIGIYDATGDSTKVRAGKGTKEVSILNAGYSFADDWGILARIGVSNDFPDKEVSPGAKNAYALTNGLLFFTYTPKFLEGDTLRTAFYLGVTVPIGSGGGNRPDMDARRANAGNMLVRSAMDNALFAVNDLAIIPGVDIAYVDHGLTVQLELTYLEIMRVRGENQQSDVAKRNLVGGLFVGYAFIPQLSVGVELRYQRWLKPPHAVRNLRDSAVEATKEQGDVQMQNMAIALGLRGNFKIGEKTFFRPAISYAMGVAGQIADQKYHLIQLDLPFAL